MRMSWLLVAAVGCGVAPEARDPSVESDAALALELEEAFAGYVEALVADDVDGAAERVSDEVLARGEQRGISFERFVEKQRKSMVKTFHLEDGSMPAFEVASLEADGDAVRVVMALDGVELSKPFWFVKEDGRYALNILPPGFSKEAPDGAAFGSSSYRIKSTNTVNQGGRTMSCSSGEVMVPAGGTRDMTCYDDCNSWWAGAIFQSSDYGSPRRSCDYNSWGDDVYIDADHYSYGWDCNDYC